MRYRRRIKHFKRYRQILRALIRYGFEYLIISMGIYKIIPLLKQRLKRLPPNFTIESYLALSMREIMMELGPTFVKLGQMLSTRPDMFPPMFIMELEKLQDKVDPFPYEQVVQQLEKEIGHPQEIFADFTPEPLAAASIGQVHRAVLKTGETVIVKIQRPGIDQQVDVDLEILYNLARFLEKRVERARRMELAAFVDEYAQLLRRELDYDREAKNTDRMYNNFASNPSVVIPRVFWAYTTGRILTEEYIEGIKLSDIEEIEARNWDRRKISILGAESFLTQVMIHGFFQSDPHQGNMLLIDEETIAFIDFGAAGFLSEKRLLNLGELLMAIDNRDLDRFIATMMDMGIIDDGIDMDNFQEDLADMIEHVLSSNIGKVNIKKIREEILELAFRYKLKIPTYLTAAMKAIITVEGVGRKLDPTFDLDTIAKPMGKRVFQERMKPGNIYKHIRRKYYQDYRPLGTLPRNFNQLVRKTGEGELNVNIRVDLHPLMKRKITRLIGRLSASIIIAGWLVASAMIIQASGREVIDSLYPYGTAGFILAPIALILLILSVFQSRNNP